MNAWRELELGEKISLRVDYITSSGNAVVVLGDIKVNLGELIEDAIGEKVIVEKSTGQFGVCLNSEYRGENYLDTHPLDSYNFYENVGTHSDSEYREWIRSNSNPQSGEVFTAEIDRMGWNDMGVVDVIKDYKILVNGVTKDDVGTLVQAEMYEEEMSTNKAEKISGDLEVIDTLPSADSVENVGQIEDQESLSEDATTNTSEETSSSEEETVGLQSDSGPQTLSSLRKEAEEDAVAQVPEEATTNKYQSQEYSRS